MILQLIVYGLIVFGSTQIIAEAMIFKPIRDLFKDSQFSIIRFIGKGISCFLCVSVWMSAFISLCIYSPTSNIFPNLSDSTNNILILFINIDVTQFKILFTDAMLGSAIAWFLYCFEIYLTKK